MLVDAIQFAQWSTTSAAKWVVAGLGDPNAIVDGAEKIFNKARDDEHRQLLRVVLSWLLISGMLRHANPATLLEFTASIVETTLAALLQNVGQLPIIRHGILSNSVNAPTLELVWGQRAELVSFLVDIIECAKCFVPANGRPAPDPQALRVEYNELDVSKPENRHAIICQLQRLAKSVVAILRTSAHGDGLPEIIMREEDTRLDTDTDRIGTTPNDLIRVASGSSPPRRKQHWLFVNGIGGEYHWLDLACKKLKERFGRNTVGVFNRGDGILWDLVECAGERSHREQGNTTSKDNLIQRTASSMEAQALLGESLGLMLQQAGPDAVVVAHSQGCLLLRLVLEDLANTDDKKIHKQMEDNLCVFTFGNPSIHWKVENRPDVALASYSCRTEHFANNTDFVAKLGVLSDETGGDNGYSNVFVNESWKGHLFGAQYSLDDGDYNGGHESWLLNCRNAHQPIGPPA
ncbi:hypothetical protein C8A01DRAFT_16875 [Parachaetomium inaequale]|uniref:Uncharacterized protein n=1 Tax=Parachaetomium inaequale TaxID=2588326 RepID=A0AAN6SQQ8_9PEZI|nr:hypothetical protein C8A01DRAFT_16875 [Parachaetomium inaequale]